jgi:hypothetical protein
MRRLSALAIAVIVLAACGGTTVTDPYQVVDKSASATYDVVQVNVGVNATGSTPLAIDPSAIQLVVDHKNSKAEFKVSLPLAQLGADARSLAQLGITSGNLDLDVVYDGQALYANGDVVTTGLALLMTQAGLKPGDLTGWLRIGTKDDFTALAGTLGQLAPSAMPSMAPIGSHDPASIKRALDDLGITLTYVGAEKRANKDTAHLSVAVDTAKLASSPAFDKVPSSQAATIKAGLQQLAVAADVWVDSSSYRLVEVDLHLAPKDGSSGKVDLTILVSQPTDTSGLAAPSPYKDIPLSQLLSQLLKGLGQGLLTQ